MRVLMIAPQPFLEERGAPFAIYHHIKVLLEMDVQVDLVTYHVGQAVHLPGLRIFRIPKLPFVREVKVGPSFAKIPLDILVFFVALWRLCICRYVCVYTHEEAGMMGILIGALFGCKHLYYMHSDLSQQLVSSEFIERPWLIRLAQAIQKFMARHADSIIAICPDIETTAKRIAPATPIYMIENSAVDEGLPSPDPVTVAHLRQELRLDDATVLLYTGNLECYQGIELLLESIPVVKAHYPRACYLFVGGQQRQIDRLQALAQELGIADAVHFTGQRPLAEMPAYMALADVLLSPRIKGTNTPLKLYTYLRSGTPILATAIFSQTQVLSPDIAMLVEPTAQGLAEGAVQLLCDPAQARLLGERGRAFAEDHYSWPVFLKKSQLVQQEFLAEAKTALSIVG